MATLSFLPRMSKSYSSRVDAEFSFNSLIPRRSQNANHFGRKSARFYGEASRINVPSGPGGIYTTNSSRRDSVPSVGDISISRIFDISANKRKRPQPESHSNYLKMHKSVYGIDVKTTTNLRPSESIKYVPYFVACNHCGTKFYGLVIYENHLPCHLAPFLLEFEEDYRRLESLQNQIQNCGHLFERISKFVDEQKKQPEAINANVEQKVVKKIENADDANSKLQSKEFPSKSELFIPKLSFGINGSSFYNRIKKSNQIRAKIRAFKPFVYLKSQLIDKQQVNQSKQFQALERSVKEMHELAESLIIKSNSIRNSARISENRKNSSSVSPEPQVEVEGLQEEEEESKIEIEKENKVPEQQILPVWDPLLDQELGKKVLEDRTNLLAGTNTFILFELSALIPLDPAHDDVDGFGLQNENNPDGDWICPQCFGLISELIRNKLETENIETINQELNIKDFWKMDKNRVAPYCCLFYANSSCLEPIKFAWYRILDQEN